MPHGPTLGSFLRDAREACGLSVDALASATRIGPRHLQALEEDRLGDLPAPVFARGFIRAYCAGVGAQPLEALALYDAQVRGAAPEPPVPERAGRARPGLPAVLESVGPEPRRSRAVPALIAVALLLLGGALYLFAGPAGPGFSAPSARALPR